MLTRAALLEGFHHTIRKSFKASPGCSRRCYGGDLPVGTRPTRVLNCHCCYEGGSAFSVPHVGNLQEVLHFFWPWFPSPSVVFPPLPFLLLQIHSDLRMRSCFSILRCWSQLFYAIRSSSTHLVPHFPGSSAISTHLYPSPPCLSAHRQRSEAESVAAPPSSHRVIKKLPLSHSVGQQCGSSSLCRLFFRLLFPF